MKIKSCAYLLLAVFMTMFSAGCGGGGGTTPAPKTLVCIAVTPTIPSIALNTTQQFTATGTFSDNTTQDLTASVTWSSSDTSKATISNDAGSNGKATALAAGTPTITAKSGSISGTTTLTVTSATISSIAVTPTNPSIALGTTQQFTATGTFSDSTKQDLTTLVTWSSSTTSVATISNAAGSNGKATSVAVGSSTITATSGSISGSTTLSVTPATLVSIAVTPTIPSIALGTTQQFTATGTFSDNTTQDLTTSVTWSSSVTSVAAISNAAGSNGKATPVAVGTSTITAASGNISGTTTLTVTPATLVSIAVTPTNSSIVLGTTQQFTAIGSFSDNTTQDLTTSATWSSSATSVAAISNAAGSKGKATPLATGSTTITAALPVSQPLAGTISGSTTLTVTPATLVSIAVTPTIPSIALGTTQQFTATGTFSDSSTQDLTTSVTWSSSTTSVAAISNASGSNGKATSIAAGTSAISATFGNVSGSASLTVTPATLVSIAVTPTNPNIALGTTQQFTATGTFSDNTTQDLTTLVTWSSSATSVAAISNAAGSNGKATALAAGTSTISATFGNVSGSTILTAQPTNMTVTIAMNPPIRSLATLQFTLVNGSGATYNNDITAINGASGQLVSVGGRTSTSMNIGLVSSGVFDTLATPIIQLSYSIAPGSGFPGVQVSPTGITAGTGTGTNPTPITLNPSNFVVDVKYN